MSYAKINTNNAVWDDFTVFPILRAVYFLHDFYDVHDIYIDLAKPPQEVLDTYRKSMEPRKRDVVFHWNSDVKDVVEFSAPLFKVLLNDTQVLELGIPDIPNLTDFHVHTKFAYCSENMDVNRAIAIAKQAGVKYINFSEHSGHLYFSPQEYWPNLYLWNNRNIKEDKTLNYQNFINEYEAKGFCFGSELDVDNQLNVIDITNIPGFRVGAIHFLQEGLTFEEKQQEYLKKLDALLQSKIDILAHPFRVFLKSKLPMPKDIYHEVADKLVKYNVAAEINFHTNKPVPEFIDLVLKKGGKISFGTDSHNLYEVGYLRPHYDFCKSLGIEGKLDELLLSASSLIKSKIS